MLKKNNNGEKMKKLYVSYFNGKYPAKFRVKEFSKTNPPRENDCLNDSYNIPKGKNKNFLFFNLIRFVVDSY